MLGYTRRSVKPGLNRVMDSPCSSFILMTRNLPTKKPDDQELHS